MEITFRTQKLKKTFDSEKDLKRAYGDRMARAIMRRLAVLKNAGTLALVPTLSPDRLHLLTGNRHGQYAVDLVHPYRLVFKPNHDPVPLKEDGGIDKERVTKITIREVVDYH